MLEAFLIAKTQIDASMLTSLSRLLNRSITKSIDDRSLRFGTLGSYLSVLQEFALRGSDPIRAQQDGGYNFQHIMLSFVVATNREDFFELAGLTQLSYIRADDPNNIIWVSGTLTQFRSAVIDGCSSNCFSLILKAFATRILEAMDKAGLGRVFANYSRSLGPDGFLLLK